MLKKAIDKVLNSGYNIRTGLEVSNREEYTFDKAITDRVFTNLKFLDETLSKVSPIPYVIAGGAVRDGLLGLEPKDYDIFLDMSPVAEMEDDERVDFIALLNYNFHEKVGPQFPGVLETPWPVSNPAYKDMENNFLVYEHAFRGPADDPARIVENTYQIIYRNNSPDISSDPLGFVVNNFDWPLTKAYYKDGKVFVGQQFVDTMKTKKIESTDLTTSRRIRSWYQRNFHRVAKAFKISIEPVASFYDIETTTTGTTANLRMWDPIRPPAAINEWPRADELPPRQGQIQLNQARLVHQDFLDGVQWGVADNNENQAEVAPAVPEV